MTFIEHVKSDSDVLKLILISFSLSVLCVSVLLVVVWTCALRPKRRRKRKEFQRPLSRSQQRTPSVSRSGYSTPFESSLQRSWSPQGFSHFLAHWSSPKILCSPNESSSPVSFLTTSSASAPVQDLSEASNGSSHFLGEVLACINTSEKAPSPAFRNRWNTGRSENLKHGHAYKSNHLDLFSVPLYGSKKQEASSSLLAESEVDLSSLSAIESTETSSPNDGVSLTENWSPVTHDKAVNTESIVQEREKETKSKDENSSDTSNTRIVLTVVPNKQGKPPRIWSHQCQLPCHSELLERIPYTRAFSSESSSSGSVFHQESEDKSSPEDQDKFDLEEDYFYEEIDQNGRGTLVDKHSTRGADASVQTDCCHHFHFGISNVNKCPLKPIRTFNTPHNTRTSCKPKAKHKSAKKSSKVKKNFDIELEERLEEEAELSLLNRTSFIPPKNWYSLGSLCDDDEICQTCGKGNDFTHHHNHHVNSDDSDTKGNNIPAMNGLCFYDTGYTSTEEEEEEEDNASSNPNGVATASDSRLDRRLENGSYDADQESDSDEVNKGAAVYSDNPVLRMPRSIGDPVPIEQYAEEEWKGDTPKALAIRQGYAAISSRLHWHFLRRIRGDNYCAVRATLFQALLNQVPILPKIPDGHVSKIPDILCDLTNGGIVKWNFAGRLAVDEIHVLLRLREFLDFLIEQANKSMAIDTTASRADYLLSLFNDASSDDEFHLLEAAKLLMYYTAVQLYRDMKSGKDVPVCAWLLYARDSSPDPHRLLTHHLNCVGDSGGLEQVEMCLLGYSLGVVIQVVRPSQVGHEDFIAYYPTLEDLPAYAPTVTLIAEDDRHYNIVS